MTPNGSECKRAISDARLLREIIDQEVRAMDMRDTFRFQLRVYEALRAIRYGFARELESLNVWSGVRGLLTIRALLVAQVDEIDRVLAEGASDGRQL